LLLCAFVVVLGLVGNYDQNLDAFVRDVNLPFANAQSYVGASSGAVFYLSDTMQNTRRACVGWCRGARTGGSCRYLLGCLLTDGGRGRRGGGGAVGRGRRGGPAVGRAFTRLQLPAGVFVLIDAHRPGPGGRFYSKSKFGDTFKLLPVLPRCVSRGDAARCSLTEHGTLPPRRRRASRLPVKRRV
jgi:hypothetical protein